MRFFPIPKHLSSSSLPLPRLVFPYHILVHILQNTAAAPCSPIHPPLGPINLLLFLLSFLYLLDKILAPLFLIPIFSFFHSSSSSLLIVFSFFCFRLLPSPSCSRSSIHSPSYSFILLLLLRLPSWCSHTSSSISFSSPHFPSFLICFFAHFLLLPLLPATISPPVLHPPPPSPPPSSSSPYRFLYRLR